MFKRFKDYLHIKKTRGNNKVALAVDLSINIFSIAILNMCRNWKLETLLNGLLKV